MTGTIFVREDDWRTGRMTSEELSAWLSRRRIREQVLLTMLSEHRYLTTDHIHALFFVGRTRRAVQLSLRAMRAGSGPGVHLGLVARWAQMEPVIARDQATPRITGWRRRTSLWLLTDRGAAAVAVYRDLEPGAVIRRAMFAAEYMSDLEHALDTNSFFVDLAEAARERSDEGLYNWVGDDAMRRNYRELGMDVAPDGWGRYLTPSKEVLFAIEWDRGTEGAQRWTRKVQTYAREQAGPERAARTVLVIVPSPTRERSVREAVARGLGRTSTVRVWTTDARLLAERGPLAALWLEVGNAAGDRHRLTDLPGRERTARRVEDCIGKPMWWERRPGAGEGDSAVA
jgi:hypothetical protein